MSDVEDFLWRVGFSTAPPNAVPPRKARRVRLPPPPPPAPDGARECGRCDVCGTPLYLRAPPGAVRARVEWWCDHGPR